MLTLHRFPASENSINIDFRSNDFIFLSLDLIASLDSMGE